MTMYMLSSSNCMLMNAFIRFDESVKIKSMMFVLSAVLWKVGVIRLTQAACLQARPKRNEHRPRSGR